MPTGTEVVCSMNGPGSTSKSCSQDPRRGPDNHGSSGDGSSCSDRHVSSDKDTSPLVLPPKPVGARQNAPRAERTEEDRPSLGQVILKVYELPDFLPTLLKLVSDGTPSRVRNVWEACEEILDTGASNREAIVADLVAAVVNTYRNKPEQGVISPPPRVAAVLFKQLPPESAAIQQQFRTLRMDPLEVAADPTVLGSSSAQLLFTIVRANYAAAITYPERHDNFAKIVRHLVLQPDGSSLAMCVFLRDRYQECRGWIGREAEADFLWMIRDEATSLCLTSHLESEANLKIALMYRRDVPHPSLDRMPQPLLSEERWILDHPWYLQEAFGFEHTNRILSRQLPLPLTSASFMYLGSAPEATIRGVHEGASKFDIDNAILTPLSRALGIRHGGGVEASSSPRQSRERNPRSWVSRDDEIRFRQGQITVAFRHLAEAYWNPQMPDRARQRGLELIRAVVHEQPYALALAAPSLRKLGEQFYGDVCRCVRQEALATLQQTCDLIGENSAIRPTVVVADGFGLSIPELRAAATREFERALQYTTGEMMQQHEHAAFLNAMRMFCTTSPILEARARELMHRYSETLGGAYLARFRFEVRDPDPSLKEFVHQHAQRVDLEPRVWIQYAHAAVGLGLDENQRDAIRKVFESHYEGAVQVCARWNPRLRASFRMVVGSLYPDRIGAITPLQRHHNQLAHSSLEARVVREIRQIAGIKVAQDIFIPWAPAIDGVVVSDETPNLAIPLLIDGECYHSVNRSWRFRGFDGHSILAKNIICGGGYPVIRVSAQLGELGMERALRECIEVIVNYLSGKGSLNAERLVVDPPDDYSDIAGKVMFYQATGYPRNPYAAVYETWHALEQSQDDELGDSDATQDEEHTA